MKLLRGRREEPGNEAILESVPVLKFYSCDLDDKACDALCNFIPLLKNLTEFDIGENPVKPGGCVKLLQPLYTHSQHLQLLDIASVTLGPSDIKMVSKLINPHHGTLETLKIGDEGVTSDCNRLILTAVLGPSSLRELDIRGCDLLPHVNVFRDQLKCNKNLEKMQFMWCKMGRDVAVSIADCLAENKILRTLRIRHPSVGVYSEGASAIAKMIQVNPYLHELVLVDDSVNENVAA